MNNNLYQTIEELKNFWDDYQEKAWRTCLPSCQNWDYLSSGLFSEAGEVFDKIKKQIRGDYNDCPTKFMDGIKGEIGDLIWYTFCGLTLKGASFNTEALSLLLEGTEDDDHISCRHAAWRIIPAVSSYIEAYNDEPHACFAEILLYAIHHLCTHLGFTLEEAAEYNIKKLAKRYSEDKIMGAGDYR